MTSHRHGPARRRAGRSLLAVGAALLLASGCFGWGQRGFDAGKTGYNPSEKTLAAATVAGLAPVWGVNVHAGQVVSSGGQVHALVGSAIVTYDAGTGEQVWSRASLGRVGSDFLSIVGDTLVYTYGDYFISGAGGTEVWTTRTIAYDPATGAFDPDPINVLSSAEVVPFTSEANHAVGVVAGRRVIVSPAFPHTSPTDPPGDLLYAWFAAGQTTGPNRGIAPGPRTAPVLNQDGNLVYSTRTDADTPTVEAWPVSCPVGPCTQLWSHPGSSADAAFEASANTLYVGGPELTALDGTTGAVKWSAPVSSGKPAIRAGTAFVQGGGVLSAVPSCGGTVCPPAWTASEPAPSTALSPVAAGDVVYVAGSTVDGSTTTVHAYDADGCGAPQCEPLATVTAARRAEDMLVAGGRLVVQTSSGVFGFGLPG